MPHYWCFKHRWSSTSFVSWYVTCCRLAQCMLAQCMGLTHDIIHHPPRTRIAPTVLATDCFGARISKVWMSDTDIETGSCTQRKQKNMNDIGDLSQCLCGLVISATQMGTKAIQCQKPGCETEWVSKLTCLGWIIWWLSFKVSSCLHWIGVGT
jgi:hypothetical protein